MTNRTGLPTPPTPLTPGQYPHWKQQQLTLRGEPLPFLTAQPRPWTHGTCSHCSQPLQKNTPSCDRCATAICPPCSRINRSNSQYITDRAACPVLWFHNN